MAELDRYFSAPTKRVALTPLSVAETGISQVGDALMNTATVLDSIKQRDEQFWVQKQLSDLDRQAGEIWETVKSTATDGAVGIENQYLTQLDALYETAKTNAPSMRAAQQLDLGITRARNNQAQVALGFATEEKFAYRRDTILNEADNLGQTLYRQPGVEPYMPQGGLITPGTTPAGLLPGPVVNPRVDTGQAPAPAAGGASLPAVSVYYTPRDLGEGAGDNVVRSVDWVSDQFGYGKLQVKPGMSTQGGKALDFAVADLPQGERNRLYSLLSAAGADTFTLREGNIHAVWGGPGGTTITGGDYALVPVAAPGQAGGPKPGVVTGEWREPNQYPWLAQVSMTAQNETGGTDLATGSLQIVPDSGGTKSYGFIGLNTGGSAGRFAKEFGGAFGITAAPGSAEFDRQWTQAVRTDPQGMIQAQLAYHERYIIAPAQRALVDAGAMSVANDPRVTAFVADLVVQYGAGGAKKHIAAGAGARDAATFIELASRSTRATIDQDFKTALSENPQLRQGLFNRMEARARNSMTLSGTGGAIATGNVPVWNGPVPDINSVPGYSDRMERIHAMVETIGGTPDQRRDLERDLEAQVVSGWLSRVAEVNPPAAMAALMSGRYDEALTLPQQAALTGASQNGIDAMEATIRQNQKDLLANLKVEAQTALADEVASLATTGKSLGKLNDAHLSVLSAAEIEELGLASFKFGMDKRIAGASSDELPAILDELKPDGEGFAAEAVRYNYAVERIKARNEALANDPAEHVLQTYPQMAERWSAAYQSGDPSMIAANIQAMLTVQRDMGVQKPQLLPKSAADFVQSQFNNAELPEADRVKALTDIVTVTDDPEQRRMIFDQLVAAGIPDTAEGGMEALIRGDSGAARRLFQAAMVDPSKLPGKVVEQTSAINEAIQYQLMDEGQVGDRYYGLTNGDALNIEAATRDSKLITSAVQLRLAAGENLDQAVTAVGKDLFGDVVPVNGNWDVNAQILLPRDEDPAPVLAGLAALKGQVREALKFSTPDMDAAMLANGAASMFSAVTGNYTELVMSEGYFRNSGDGYVFIDPFVGGAVVGANGKPLVFTDQQVLDASKLPPQTSPQQQSMDAWMTGETYQAPGPGQ